MHRFDPFAASTVRTAKNLEPSFVHPEQVALARRKLGGRRCEGSIYTCSPLGVWGSCESKFKA